MPLMLDEPEGYDGRAEMAGAELVFSRGLSLERLASRRDRLERKMKRGWPDGPGRKRPAGYQSNANKARRRRLKQLWMAWGVAWQAYNRAVEMHPDYGALMAAASAQARACLDFQDGGDRD